MSTEYERLRAALQAEIDEPGPITKAEAREVLASVKPEVPTDGDFGPEFGYPDFD